MQTLNWILAKLAKYKEMSAYIFKTRTETQGCKETANIHPTRNREKERHFVYPGHNSDLWQYEGEFESRYKKC